ncbi:phospholipase A-2-activating, partial [Olea europaea subsp. europaea]
RYFVLLGLIKIEIIAPNHQTSIPFLKYHRPSSGGTTCSGEIDVISNTPIDHNHQGVSLHGFKTSTEGSAIWRLDGLDNVCLRTATSLLDFPTLLRTGAIPSTLSKIVGKEALHAFAQCDLLVPHQPPCQMTWSQSEVPVVTPLAITGNGPSYLRTKPLCTLRYALNCWGNIFTRTWSPTLNSKGRLFLSAHFFMRLRALFKQDQAKSACSSHDLAILYAPAFPSINRSGQRKLCNIQELGPIFLIGTHKVPEIALQQSIHPFCLSIRLRVKACREVRPVNRGSRSLIMLRGNPQYFTTFLKNSLAASSAVQSLVTGMKVPYLENRSTTTIIDPNPSDLGRALMKSMVIESHGRSGTGRGSNKPADNPYDVADKWLIKENLPLSFREQIVEFILQNTGQKNFTPDPSFRDPYTGSSAYIPGAPSKSSGVSKPTYKHIPKKGMLVFDMAQFDGILKKVSEFNNALLSDPEKQHLSLTEGDMLKLGSIVKILKDTSHYHSSTFSDLDVALIVKLLKTWPLAMIFPVVDVMRMTVLHPDGAIKLLQHVKDGNDTIMELIKKVTASPPLPANLLTSLRAVTNLFKSSCFHEWLRLHRMEILDAFSSFYSSSNKNVQLSYATLILNFAVLLIEKKDEEGQSQVLSAALEIAEEESVETDSRFRALVAIGSLMLEGLVRRIALDFDVENIAKAAKSSKDAKIAEVGADIELVAKQN